MQNANVSYHLAIHMKGNTRSIGTEGACKVFEENREKFEDDLVDDALIFCNGKIDKNVEDSDNGKKAGAKEMAYRLKQGEGVAKLPFPLSLMNRKEKLSYLLYLITYDRFVRLGIDSTKIKVGIDTWEARFCPNTVLKLLDLKTKLGSLNSEHLDGDTPTKIFTTVIL